MTAKYMLPTKPWMNLAVSSKSRSNIMGIANAPTMALIMVNFLFETLAKRNPETRAEAVPPRKYNALQTDKDGESLCLMIVYFKTPTITML